MEGWGIRSGTIVDYMLLITATYTYRGIAVMIHGQMFF